MVYLNNASLRHTVIGTNEDTRGVMIWVRQYVYDTDMEFTYVTVMICNYVEENSH